MKIVHLVGKSGRNVRKCTMQCLNLFFVCYNNDFEYSAMLNDWNMISD